MRTISDERMPIERMTRAYIACGDFTDNPEACMYAAVQELHQWFLEHWNDDGPLGLACGQAANAVKIVIIDQAPSSLSEVVVIDQVIPSQ